MCAGGSRQPWPCFTLLWRRAPATFGRGADAERARSGGTASRSPASQPRSRTEDFWFFQTRFQKRARNLQLLSVDRRADRLQNRASRHSRGRTRLGETTSWTDDGRQDRSDKLEVFGAGEGARTLDPDLGKVGVVPLKHLAHIAESLEKEYYQLLRGYREF